MLRTLESDLFNHTNNVSLHFMAGFDNKGQNRGSPVTLDRPHGAPAHADFSY